MRRVYLDHNATTPVRPELREALAPLIFAGPEDERFGNASSVHWAGQRARRELEQARAELAQAFTRRPSDVIFTSGGTEADNLALFGVLTHRAVTRPRLLVSQVEHPAVMAGADTLARAGVDVVKLPVDGAGQLDLGALELALQTPTTLVSVMAVNNETGIISPMPEVLDRVHAAGALLHVDAVQAVGRLPLDAGPDLITISGHKLGGLKGVGALIIREGVQLAPGTLGGPQERGHRAGTEPVALAVSLAHALRAAEADRPGLSLRWAALRDRIDRALEGLPGVRVLGGPRVSNTTCAVLSGVDGEVVLQGLDLEGIAASSGSACSSGSLEPSHVLRAMGISPEEALSALRFSLGWSSAEADVDRLIEVLPGVIRRAQQAQDV